MRLFELTEKIADLEETIENLDGCDIPAEGASHLGKTNKSNPKPVQND